MQEEKLIADRGGPLAGGRQPFRAIAAWRVTPRIAAIACAALLATTGVALAYRRLAPAEDAAKASASNGEPEPASTGARAIGEPRPRATSNMESRVPLGRKIFLDANLSDPPGTSCASCHDPARGYGGINGSSIGVARGSHEHHFARRNTPSVLYLKFVRRFHFRWDEDEPLPDAMGGFFWDGRSDSIASLVRQPLLNPDEMGNRDARQIADKIAESAYADEFRREFGTGFDDAEKVLGSLGSAVEAFLLSREMAPFSSKYDGYIRGKASLSAMESRGLELFKDRQKGGCDACHKMNDHSPNPEFSLFTDYGYDIVAVPRNRLLPGNRNPNAYDLGLCERNDPRTHTDEQRLCGSFRTPSLRNVATRPSFMHNGAFTSLRDVVSFYATRATHPERWYRAGPPFDDLPAKYRDQVNVTSVPYNRRRGQQPLMNDADIDAIVAFLKTLTDSQYVVAD
jgi:cytochrome c peroxidase